MTSYADALAYLDGHSNYDVTGRITSPTLERMSTLMAAMGDPQLAFPVIHVTGTNGKGSTTQMITRLLMAHGLTVGTYTSPHLERINERINRNCEPISDDDFAEQIAAVADLEGLTGVHPSYFEAVTAAAYRWFADVAVDVAVVGKYAWCNWLPGSYSDSPSSMGTPSRCGASRSKSSDGNAASKWFCRGLCRGFAVAEVVGDIKRSPRSRPRYPGSR